jgi:hypothetical protein
MHATATKLRLLPDRRTVAADARPAIASERRRVSRLIRSAYLKRQHLPTPQGIQPNRWTHLRILGSSVFSVISCSIFPFASFCFLAAISYSRRWASRCRLSRFAVGTFRTETKFFNCPPPANQPLASGQLGHCPKRSAHAHTSANLRTFPPETQRSTFDVEKSLSSPPRLRSS